MPNAQPSPLTSSQRHPFSQMDRRAAPTNEPLPGTIARAAKSLPYPGVIVVPKERDMEEVERHRQDDCRHLKFLLASLYSLT